MGKTAAKVTETGDEIIEDGEANEDEELEVNDESEVVDEESEDDLDDDDGENSDSKGSKDEDGEADEIIVTIGEEAPPSDETEQAPEWVKELRKNHRETTRRNKELEQKIKDLEEGGKTPQPLGPRPKLEDFDYDADKYDKALDEWYGKKREVDQREREIEEKKQDQDKAWQQQLQSHVEKKTGLKVKDYDDAEAEVIAQLDVTQQGIIVQGAENSALVMYVLGKNPKELHELSSITDPVKFAFAVAKLEAQLKVKNRKAPPPEKKPSTGTAAKSGSVDSTLERLRAEAAKTGDYTKVTRYKKQKRAQAK